ncbi:MAG: CRISPR-associated helicase Cas3 [Puniceicoccaceae bacterium 5H]|nr:MAG: CRISPR-associated helicase Cas3 [Puniceicoccaceae bacterium 5H]
MKDISLQDFWAKTDEMGQPALSVRDHCLNVGAVAEVLRDGLPPALRAQLPDGAVGLVACHDVGKISPGFQLKSPVWARTYGGLCRTVAAAYQPNHSLTGFDALFSHYSREGKAPAWLLAVGGHHGKYLIVRLQPYEEAPSGQEVFVTHREQLIRELVAHFGALPTETIKPKSPRVHWFTGFMILSDWIGSSPEWFPLNEPEALTREVALDRAQRALADLGWARRDVKAGQSFTEIFSPDPVRQPFQPRPLQQTLLESVDAQGLYIVEAPMGEGKTEAALALAYARWSEGEERGLYFALPTQLTSNRIQERVERFLQRVVAEPSVVALIHGSAWLSERRSTVVQPREDDNTLSAHQWFSDNRKNLLHPFGVGTVDQALLAAIPVKFAALRFFALSGKVIVIDEVHSYDPYTSVLLDFAVSELLQCGCTVVILSATLTRQRRAELVQAAGAKEESPVDSYPLITCVRSGETTATSIPVAGASPRQLTVVLEQADPAAEDWLRDAVEAADQGACVLIIRNTVALAQETYRLAKNGCREGTECGLLHSRFPQFAREINEERWTDKLGPSAENRPRGCILVGTQVLEQSLDIDADLLFTDLAPIDLIIQRLGRLHRHRRARPVEFETARAVVLQPTVPWEASPEEALKALGPSAYIYPPWSLYQAQRICQAWNQIQLPSDIRKWLEASSVEPDTLPAAAKAFLEEYREARRKQRNVASAQQRFSGDVKDDESRTRWGKDDAALLVLARSVKSLPAGQTQVVLLDGSEHRVEHGRRFDFELAKALHRNAVRVRRYLLKGAEPASGLPWLGLHIDGAFLALCTRDSLDCEVVAAAEALQHDFSYSPELGLHYFKKEQAGPTAYDTEEPAWF